jgi:hypothetical protein
LGGRTARYAEPVDPAIRTTHKCQCIAECVVFDRDLIRGDVARPPMDFWKSGRAPDISKQLDRPAAQNAFKG